MLGVDEPFTNLLTQGMVLAESYYLERSEVDAGTQAEFARSTDAAAKPVASTSKELPIAGSGSAGSHVLQADSGKVEIAVQPVTLKVTRREWVNPADVEVQRDARGKIISARRKSDGTEVTYDGIGTMSKSKNNGVDPQALIDKYGADTARFYTMFASPPTNTLEWSDESVDGSYRFLRKVWDFAVKFSRATCAETVERKIRYQIHLELKKANDDIERQKFNTVASACMKILNALEELPEWDATSKEGLSILLRLLSPIAPHITHHLWRELGFGEDIMRASWPEPDPAALEQDEVELVVQVNGKLRGSIRVPKAADRGAIEGLALANPNVQRFVAGQHVKKVVVVPGRLINLVV
jgi:leucyl-tRNA synthetase